MLDDIKKLDITYNQLCELLEELGNTQYHKKKLKHAIDTKLESLVIYHSKWLGTHSDEAQKLLDEYGLDYQVDELI